MSDHFAIIGCGFFVSLLCAAVVFSLTFKNAFLREHLLSVVLGFVGALVVSVSLVVSVAWYPFDFVQQVTALKFLLPLFATLLIVPSVWADKPYTVAGSVFVASIVTVFGTGMFITFYASLPTIVNKLLTIAGLWGYAMGYRAISGLNPMPQLEALMVNAGFVLLGFLGFAPAVLSAEAAGIVAILIIAYLNSDKCSVGIAGAPILGFVSGYLGLMSYGEYLFPCFLIFSMFYLVDLAGSLLKKCSLMSKYSNLIYNSVSVEAFDAGLPANVLVHMVFIAHLILLILGLFQVYAVNTYSLPLFAAMVTIWQQYRLLHWQQESMTLKETNKILVQDVKQSIVDLLAWGKNKDNKTDDRK